MLRKRSFGRVCALATAFSFLLTGLFLFAAQKGLISQASAEGYSKRLFDTSFVHTIDISMSDWEGFLETCTDEEYVSCSVTVDGEKYANVAIRAKGNTSLSNVAQFGNNRYSLKIEFDHYDSTQTYYGLDKLCLNNFIQDKTMMKDYIAYTLMNRMGVASPECSYVWITVNGEDWGLFLAVEGVEDAFLERNYGSDSGNLYKPDSMSFGGGRGNGRDFSFSDFDFSTDANESGNSDAPNFSDFAPDSGGNAGFDGFDMPDFDAENMPELPDASGSPFGGFGNSEDVKLQYIDDDPESYSNIFNSAKTDVAEEDQTRLIASLKTLSEGADIASVVNTDRVMRYLAVHDFLLNGDSYTGSMVHNYYLYEKDGVLEMIPWDYNLAFGAFFSTSATDSANAPIDTPVDGGDISSRPMIAWIFNDESYLSEYHEIYAEFLENNLANGWLDAEIERVYNMIRPYVEKDPTAFYTAEELDQAVETLRKFCNYRAQSIQGQLEGTIPSTDSGQSADATNLIDASDVNMSDMGEFNQGGGDMPDNGGKPTAPGGEMPGGSNGMAPPDRPNDASGFEGNSDSANSSGESDSQPSTEGASDVPSNANTESENAVSPESQLDEAKNNESRRFESPTQSDDSRSDSNRSAALLFGISLIVLLFGLIFARRFKTGR